MHVRFSPRAEADLDHIKDYLEPKSPQGYARIRDAIFSMLLQLESFPFLGKIGRLEGTRELIVPATGYIVFYSLPDQYHINILRIMHGRQKYPPKQ